MAILPILLLLLTISTATASTDSFIMSENDAAKLLAGSEKITHFRFYWHDIASGSNPTTVVVARGPTTNDSPTLFGMVNVIDDALTPGPDLASGVVGRAQGMYASADQTAVGLLVVMNFYLTEGKYNGSYFTIVGRNPIFADVREMSVISGGGAFRYARGYVQAKTVSFEEKSGDAVIQYDCYVMHYDVEQIAADLTVRGLNAMSKLFWS